MPSITIGLSLGFRPNLNLGEIVPPELSAPANLELPTISGLPQVGESIEFFEGLWSGYPPPTFETQLKKDGVDIAGSSPYEIQPGDVGSSFTISVTATNSQGSSIANSTSFGPVEGVTPSADPLTMDGTVLTMDGTTLTYED